MKRNCDKTVEKSLYVAGWILLGLLAALEAAGKIVTVRFSMPPCIIHTLTGYYCPGCGGTRAVKAFLGGHWIQAFFCNPVVVYGGVVYLWYMASHTMEYLSRGKISIGMRYSDKYLYAAAVILVLQWIVKNVVKAVWGIGIA